MLIKLKNVQKTYSTKNGVTFRALNNVSLSFDSTGLVYLVGASGSGKSTLLNVIGGLDSYDSGEIVLAGKRLNKLKNAEIDSLRNSLMGFIFQEFNLIDTLTVYDNVKLALEMQSHKGDGAVERALEEMGISDKAKSKTKDLSGGQRQRVGIARALVKNPRLILADEPTGSLDKATSEEVATILKEMSKTRLVIVVTHDMETAIKTGDRIIEMKDGRIYRDVRRKKDGEVIETVNTQMYSDTLMAVPANVEVNDLDTDKLNDVLSRSVRKTYVTVESDPRKVKALYPNLREAVSDTGSGKGKKKEDDGELSSDMFVPFTDASGEMETVEFKRSRLSFVQAVKLALNNLGFKKLRLAITIIVAFLAFTFFGVSQSFASYDMRAAVTKTIEKEEMTHVALASSQFYAYSYGESYKGTEDSISESELSRLSDMLPDATVTRQYNIFFDEWGRYTSYSLAYFKGVVETDDVSELGLKILYGKGSCASYDEIIISEYAALSLIKCDVVRVSSPSLLVGSTLSLNDGEYEFKVVGIFECERAKEWMSNSGDNYLINALGTMGLNMLEAGGWGQLYVKKGFAERYFEDEAARGMPFNVQVTSEDMSLSGDVSFVFDDGASAGTVVPVIGDGRIEREGDFIVSSDVLYAAFGKTSPDLSAQGAKELAEKLNASENKRLILRNTQSVALYVSDNIRIVGVEDAETGSMNRIWTSGEIKKAVIEKYMLPTVIYVGLKNTSQRAVVDAAYDCSFQIVAPFMSSYGTAEMVLGVLHYILLGLAVAFCLLVVLLLYSFISTSIKLTRKHIGILRALGAKKTDTFMIYALEGVLASLCALVLSILAIAVGAPMLNAAISASTGYYFALITVTAPVFLTMTVIAAAVTLASVFIPLRKFNKITPVSAINGKE